MIIKGLKTNDKEKSFKSRQRKQILYIQKNKNKNENMLLIGKYQERRQLSSSFKY